MRAVKSANLCWSQHHHVLRYLSMPAASRHEAHITTSYPLPEGCTTEHVRSALTYLTRRHEILRTVYDLEAAPWPRQRVDPPAPPRIHEATTEDDGTPAPTEVVERLSRTAFDIGREWPLRACVITTGGALRRLHLVFNHLAFDDVSLDVLSTELDALLAARVHEQLVPLPPVPDQPVDLARYESARRPEEVDAAMEHWRGEVARLPADVYAARRGLTQGLEAASQEAALSVHFTVPSLLASARGIAHRHRVWPSAVHLAAYAVVMAAYCGEQSIAHRLYTSQRSASGFSDVLTCMSFPTLVAVDLRDDPPFSAVLRRVAERVGQSMEHAHVPYDRIEEEIARESARRGQPVRVRSELNFLDNTPRSCGTRRDRLAWNATPEDWALAGSDLYLRIYEWCDGVTLALQALGEVIDRHAAERFLRGYARLVEAHRGPGVDLRVSEAAELLGFPPASRRTLIRVGDDAVDLDRTASLLEAHSAVASARLTAHGCGIVADVVARPPVTPEELRTYLLGVMYDYPAVRCPDEFRITAIGGSDLVVRNGSGQPTETRTPAEHALVSAVQEANGLLDAVDLTHSYVAAGGRVLRSARVLALLERQGWSGVPMGALASARPLRALAQRMVALRV